MKVQVLKGGLDSGNLDRYKFISAEITNTRLMGVVAMHIVFKDTILLDEPSFHQFYYFDYEELGLETLRLLHSDDEKLVLNTSKEAFAGLGAELVSLTEDEALAFASWMQQDTLNKKQELPSNSKDISFVFIRGSKLREENPALIDSVNTKSSVVIKTDYGIVNYFLMRCFGLDFEAAGFLSDIPKDQIPLIFNTSHCTFLRNKIESSAASVGDHRYFRCESLVELEKEQRHYIVLSEIELKNRKVIRATKVSELPISSYEAGLLLSREEYVSVFDLQKELNEEFVNTIYEITKGMTSNDHPAGTMFMNFKENNDHAENKIFTLNDDIKNLFFVTTRAQIVLSSFDINGIIDGESRLMLSKLIDYIKPSGRYSFPASIIYDFAESGIDDFNAFLANLE